MDSANVQAIAATIQVLAVIPILYLTVQTVKNAKESLKENQLIRRAETDPYIAVFCDVPQGSHSIDVVIKNLGSGPAYNIRCAFSGPALTVDGDDLRDLPFLQHLPFLAPQSELRSLLSVAHLLLERREFNPVDVTVTYQNRDGDALDGTYHLDPYAFEGIIVSDSTSLKQVVKAIDENTKALKLLVKHANSIASTAIRRHSDSVNEK